MRLDVAGQVGSNDTFGGEAVASAVHENFSISAGSYNYTTDGFRKNADVKHEIYNMFTQVALTPELNVQAELRKRNSESGDLAFNFDRNRGTKPNFDRNLDTTLARVGVRWSPIPSSTVILSYIHNDRDEKQTDVIGSFKGLANSFARVEDDGDQFDAQYLYRRRNLNVTAGAGRTLVDRQTEITAKIQAAFEVVPLYWTVWRRS